MLSTPVAFLATSNPEAAMAFYAERLGLELIADEPFALVFRCGATTLRIQKLSNFAPALHTVLGWEVPDIGAAVRKLAQQGVEFLRYEHLEQDADGVWTAPGGTRIVWFKDPDGNTLSLGQPIGDA
jgi:catechol 2,3-dioxygenase-like lactoylglutathione lyase family enzyme